MIAVVTVDSQIPFRFESEMLEPLIAAIPKAFKLQTGQHARMLREPMIGSVIPDILLGTWQGEIPSLRKLNVIACHVLAWLSSERIIAGEQELQDCLSLSPHAVSSSLSTLRRIGAIERKESGEVEIQPRFDISNAVKLVAIEVKLKRWREALLQAKEYRKFSDEAYVVLDGSQIRLNEEINDAYTQSGVGLLIQSGEHLHLEICAEPKSPPPSADRLMALGKLTKADFYSLA